MARKTLKEWAAAGKKEWEQTLKAITELKVNIHYPTGKRAINVPMQKYFTTLQSIVLQSAEYGCFIRSGFNQKEFTLAKLKKMQNKLLADLQHDPDKKFSPYIESFGNPFAAVSKFGQEPGYDLCMVYTRFRNYLNLIIQARYTDLARLNRLFLDLYDLSHKVKADDKDFSAWKKLIRKYVTTDPEMHHQFNLFWRYSPDQDYFRNIILKADLDNPDYLFRYGVHISEYVFEMARFMQKYPEKELKKLSQYIVKSYQDGFVRGYRDYKIKKYAMLIIPAGLERLGRMLIKDMRKMGLEAVVARPQTQAFNKQYDYDNRFNMSVFFDKDFAEMQLKAYKKATAAMSDTLKYQAGPVYIELFGETPFSPKDNPAAFKLTVEQRQLLQQNSGQMTQVFFKHYKQQETSFCIIAFPSPEIGKNFRKIFADTVKINLLDSMHYANIQQKIIDVLDQAEYVHVKGKPGNKTDIIVKLHKLKNPDKETNFENCVADVNVPVGEVFTSPLLKGTNGTLHVKNSYLRNLNYKNLMLTFKDGMIKDYSCTNFKAAKENKKYIEENLLMPHKTLPIGEFAIGTNTLAYQVALKYDILGLLPVLILEKMGPHFAVGDTCYTREEDFDHFNFVNGKKLIAVDNEKTALRKTDPLKAYTQVHTDITLPYDMLKSITAVKKDGKRIDIIKNGMFAVPGTEELNIPLQQVLTQADKQKKKAKSAKK